MQRRIYMFTGIAYCTVTSAVITSITSCTDFLSGYCLPFSVGSTWSPGWPTSAIPLYSFKIPVHALFQSISTICTPLNRSLGSDGREIMACSEWSVHVSPPGPNLPSPATQSAQLNSAFSSWEFLTTFDFEWSIIRRRRPYRWPILVGGLITRSEALD